MRGRENTSMGCLPHAFHLGIEPATWARSLTGTGNWTSAFSARAHAQLTEPHRPGWELFIFLNKKQICKLLCFKLLGAFFYFECLKEIDVSCFIFNNYHNALLIVFDVCSVNWINLTFSKQHGPHRNWK